MWVWGVGCVGVDVGLGVSGAISRLARHNIVVSLLIPLILHIHTHILLFFIIITSSLSSYSSNFSLTHSMCVLQHTHTFYILDYNDMECNA